MNDEQGTTVSSEPILSVRNLVKRFGGLTAVDDVSLDIRPGEVVGLVGDNGAGKSTLIKCVSGVHHFDGGRIFFEGQEIRFSRPIDAREAGIETIYQDLALAGNLDVSANIFLGREMKNRYLFGAVNTLDEESMLTESSSIEGSSSVCTAPKRYRFFISRPRKMLALTSRLPASARSW